MAVPECFTGVGVRKRAQHLGPAVTIADTNLGTAVSYEGFTAIGSGMGANGFIAYDDSTCIVDASYCLSPLTPGCNARGDRKLR